jgi:hypothetical protein
MRQAPTVGSTIYLGRSLLRRRWRSIAALALAIGLVTGIAMGAVAAARRGNTALDRLVAAYHVPDVSIYAYIGEPAEQERVLHEMLDAAGITTYRLSAGATLLTFPGHGNSFSDGGGILADVTVADGEAGRSVVLEGRRAERVDEIALNRGALDHLGLGVGDTVEIAWYASADLEVLGNGGAATPAGTRSMRITGRVLSPGDLLTDARAEPGTIFDSNRDNGALGAAFWRDAGPDLATYGLGAYADATPAQVDALTQAVGTQEGIAVAPGLGTDLDGLDAVASAIHLESAAVIGFAAVLAITGLGLLGVAVGRTVNVAPGDLPSLTAIGVGREDRVRLGAALGAGVAAAAGVVAVATALTVSTRAPFGYAGDAEIAPGLDVDWPVLLAATTLAVAVVVGAAVIGAIAGGRARGGGRVARTPRWRLAWPLPATVGLRLLGQTARTQGGAAVRAGGVMAVAGAIAVTGAWSFAGSMRDLVESPATQGWNWDLAVGNYSRPETAEIGATALSADSNVKEFSAFNSDRVFIDGLATSTGGFHGDSVGPRVLEGRAPTADDEIAVGRETLRSLHKAVGDDVVVGADPQADGIAATIVGVITPPAAMADGMALDRGATMTLVGLQTALGAVSADSAAVQPVVHLVRLQPGTEARAVRDDLQSAFPGTVNTPRLTADLRSLQRVQAIPYVLAGMIGLLGFAAVVVVLAQLAGRRRRELALLRCVGFTGRQVLGVVLSQATAFALAALAVGVPLGIVGGSALWRAAADRIGTEASPVVPIGGIALAALALVAIANALALLPAIRARRAHPATVLRAD